MNAAGAVASTRARAIASMARITEVPRRTPVERGASPAASFGHQGGEQARGDDRQPPLMQEIPASRTDPSAA